MEQETLTGTLEDIVEKAEERKFRPPAVIVVGEVVRLREKLAWFEQKPLFGKRVLVTRAREQSQSLSEKIHELGGESLEFPVIKITRPKRQAFLDQSLRHLHEYDWIIFTSVNGVKFFFSRLRELKIDIRQMGKAKIAAIGPKTAEALWEKGLLVDVIPEEYQAEGLIESLRHQVKAGEKILLPRANIARKILAVKLAEMGCEVTDADAYDTETETGNVSEIVEGLREGTIHVITFTSPSTVRNFVRSLQTVEKDVPSLLKGVHIVCIGPITAQTAGELGLKVDGIAKEYTIEGLVEVLKQLP